MAINKMKLFSRLSAFYYIFFNGKFLFRILLGLLGFFLTENLYLKWSGLNPNPFSFFSISLLSIYTLVQLTIILWIYISYRKFSGLKKSKNKILFNFKSSRGFRDNLDELKDIKKFPNLKKIR